jgi:hypothetical protein
LQRVSENVKISFKIKEIGVGAGKSGPARLDRSNFRIKGVEFKALSIDELRISHAIEMAIISDVVI